MSSKEKNSLYYSKVFATSKKYNTLPEKSVYFNIWDDIINQLEGNECVVELGCGPGQFAKLFLDRHPESIYRGMDFSETAIAMARKQCSEKKYASFEVADFYDPAWVSILKTPKIPTIICLEVLEHIYIDLDILAAIPPGTPIFASVPSFDCTGHVRHFANKEEVVSRYSPFIEIETLSIYCVENKKMKKFAIQDKKRGTIFLIKGTTKDSPSV